MPVDVEQAAARTILVVEDEALLLFTIADDLRDAGFTVFEATNADAALNLLEVEPRVGVLFTDVDMPGRIDGLQLSGLVRSRWPEVKILVTSGHVALADHDLPSGGRFIPKPYTPAMIVSSIRAVLD